MTSPGPPIEVSQVSVEEGEEWERAMMFRSLWEEARVRRVRKVFSATEKDVRWVIWKGREGEVHGQPQWRRKVTMVGFPLFGGKGSFSDEGALVPNSGAGEVVIEGGESQELSSCWKVILSVNWNC